MEIHDERERNSPRTHKIFMSPWLVSTFLEEISHGLSHTKWKSSLSFSLSLLFSLSRSNFEKFHPISRILFQFWLGGWTFFQNCFFSFVCFVWCFFSRKRRRRASERSLDIKSIRSERQEIWRAKARRRTLARDAIEFRVLAFPQKKAEPEMGGVFNVAVVVASTDQQRIRGSSGTSRSTDRCGMRRRRKSNHREASASRWVRRLKKDLPWRSCRRRKAKMTQRRRQFAR